MSLNDIIKAVGKGGNDNICVTYPKSSILPWVKALETAQNITSDSRLSFSLIQV